MLREAISTSKAPAAIGPYSQAIRAGNLVFTAGQLGINPNTGELEEGIEAQTRQALLNLKAILEAAGTSLENVVKTGVFLKDIGDFPAMNAVYAEFFPHSPPARTTLQAAELPKGALVEIEAIAVIPA
ncbi:MAG: reactive intermediate/imine deaminase [Chloroflexi bacterium]|nr:MAG: reactive intermediate/imine deaminase [Chloroflexota bacterium]